jgi:hypothetical protein
VKADWLEIGLRWSALFGSTAPSFAATPGVDPSYEGAAVRADRRTAPDWADVLSIRREDLTHPFSSS